MPSITWGTGTDIFAADYLSEQVPNSGSSEWQSSDIYDNMLSALELKRMSGHFDAGVDTTTGSSTPADTPFSLVTEGASTGYYRTIKYSSQYADDYFFSQNVLMYDRHIITNVSDIQRLVWTPTVSEYNFDNAAMWDGTTSNIKCYVISQFESNKVDILKKGKTDEYTTTGVDIIPAIISPDSVNHLQGFNYWNRNSETVTWVDRQIGRYNQTYGSGSDNVARYCPVFGNQSAIILPNSSGETSKWAIDDTGNYAVRFTYKAADQYSYLWTTYCQAKYWICSKDELLHVLARSGMRFIYNNTMYKPVAENGVIIGYTDDMDKESEWDNWHDYTDHEVPITPPAPEPGDDPSDDQASGGIYGGAQGMCNLYYMTASEIKDLQNWFRGTVFAPGIQIPGNFDPSDQLIGLMAFPIELGGSVDSTTITFRTADNQSVDTGVSCQKAYGDDLKFDMGTIDIPARMQERGVPFLDYSSQIEVYIPFCDVVQLDVQQVIGTTLKCEMWISPATGDVSAMLSSGTHPVAYTSGNCAQQLPISVSSYGAIAGAKMAADNKMTQAVFQAAQNVVKDITNAGAITSAVSSHTAVNGQGLVEFSRIPQVQNNTGLAVGAGIKAAGSMVNTALNLTAQNLDNRYALSVAKNSAPTHVSGSFGACTSWHFPNYCYVKITRPHFKKPDNYGHTEAVPVVATKQLSSLTGLTTCVNPDVSSIGTATMQELETIKGYLMSGVIL